MELALQAETYTPSVDESGKYIDNIPQIIHGIYCPCGSRKNKIYETHSKFHAHCKTKIHQKWLDDLNKNRANFYVMTLQMEDTIKNQRMIIAQLEKEIITKSKTIDLLTDRLVQQPKMEMGDLIGWD